MTFKSAVLITILAFATAGSAGAAPLTQPGGLSDGASLMEPAGARRHYFGRWRGCPYWYEQNLLGTWHLVSPCTKRAITNAY